MAIRFTSAGTGLSRTTGLVAATSDYTGLVWFRPTQDLTAAQLRLVFAAYTAGHAEYAGIFSTTDATNSYEISIDGTTSVEQVLTTNTWYPLVYLRSGNFHRFLLADDQVGASVSVNITGWTFTELLLGYDGGSSVPNGDFAYFREWSNNLTSAELRAEFNSAVAVKTSELVTDTPLVADLLDDSGNGNDWTAVGANSFVAGPSFPSNSTSATATVISTLPFTESVSANIASQAFTYNRWYSYAADGSEAVLSVFGWGGTGDYAPLAGIYVSGVLYLDLELANKPLLVPLLSGTTYLITFGATFEVATADLDVSIFGGPHEAVPVGSFLVNDDTEGFPAAVISSVDADDHHVLQYHNPFPHGEQGDSLDGSGVLLVGDDADLDFKLYNADVTFNTTVTYAGSGLPVVRANQATGTFWIARPGAGAIDAKVTTVSASGVLGPEEWTLTTSGVTALCANADETILYLSGQSASTALQRFDLVNGIPLSDLAAAVAGYFISDILVIADGTLIVGYYKQTVTTDFFVRHYDTSGTILDTYAFGVSVGTPARLTWALDDPNSFWAWTHPDSATSVFSNVKVSDGSLLATTNYMEFAAGKYQGTEGETPISRYGVSPCCPFILLREPLPGGAASIIVIKVADGVVQSFSFVAGGGLDPAEFLLADGESRTYSDVTPGSGYSISEIEDPAYTTTYAVSNDSPHTNLTVAEGETVTVTVTNVLFAAETETDPIRWLRRAPVMSDENIRLFHAMFTLDLQAGMGLVSGQGADPQVMMRYSDDSGQTWSEEHWRGSGKIGEYRRRVIWRRLGVSRLRVYEIVGSDPCVVGLLDGFADVSRGSN